MLAVAGSMAIPEDSANYAPGVHLTKGWVWPHPSLCGPSVPSRPTQNMCQSMLLTSTANQLIFRWYLNQHLPQK